VTDNHGLEDNR